MSQQAPVTVVIPTYNHASLVVEAVDSVLRQTVVPVEILVVDDGSKDDTRERLAPYQEHVRYFYQKNEGVSAARNLGVRAAQGEFVAFLDSDDVWHPRKLEMQMAVFERHPKLGLLGTGWFDWPGGSFPESANAPPKDVTFVSWPQLVVRNYLITSSVVVRRNVLAQAGEFDTAMQGPEDRDLWLRIAEIAGVANLEKALTGYRSVAGSVSKQAATCQAGMLRILRKLDERKIWQGRWLLRRKAYSYVNHSCAYLHGAAGHHGTAVLNSLRSLAWYPFPYRRSEVGTSCERMRRLLVNLLRMSRLKPMETPLSTNPANHTADALKMCGTTG